MDFTHLSQFNNHYWYCSRIPTVISIYDTINIDDIPYDDWQQNTNSKNFLIKKSITIGNKTFQLNKRKTKLITYRYTNKIKRL